MSSLDSEKEFFFFINDKENGFIKKQDANGFELVVKYLPPTYLAYLEAQKEIGNGNFLDQYNRLLPEFLSAKTFILTIDPGLNISDPTYYNVGDLSDYKERIQEMNFNMKDHIYILLGNGKKIFPLSTSMENIYDLQTKKTIYLVFPDNDNILSKADLLDFVFEDTFLNTGINHFQFYKKDLDNLPELNFIKNGI
ncbi:MAG: hypothetical protein Q8P20_03820 [bacterium]|nr:hypothetical protein [bacterium]